MIISVKGKHEWFTESDVRVIRSYSTDDFYLKAAPVALDYLNTTVVEALDFSYPKCFKSILYIDKKGAAQKVYFDTEALILSQPETVLERLIVNQNLYEMPEQSDEDIDQDIASMEAELKHLYDFLPTVTNFVTIIDVKHLNSLKNVATFELIRNALKLVKLQAPEVYLVSSSSLVEDFKRIAKELNYSVLISYPLYMKNETSVAIHIESTKFYFVTPPTNGQPIKLLTESNNAIVLYSPLISK